MHEVVGAKTAQKHQILIQISSAQTPAMMHAKPQTTLPQKLLYAGVYVGLWAAKSLMVKASKVDGKYPYNVVSLTFSVEFIKLVLAYCYYRYLKHENPDQYREPLESKWVCQSLLIKHCQTQSRMMLILHRPEYCTIFCRTCGVLLCLQRVGARQFALFGAGNICATYQCQDNHQWPIFSGTDLLHTYLRFLPSYFFLVCIIIFV